MTKNYEAVARKYKNVSVMVRLSEYKNCKVKKSVIICACHFVCLAASYLREKSQKKIGFTFDC